MTLKCSKADTFVPFLNLKIGKKMKKTIWTFGIIAGLICSVWMAGFILMGKYDDFDNGMIYGYASMLIAFSMIFVGIKNYRDKQLNGSINFKTAFTIGLFITLIASTFYVVTWLICYYNFLPDIGDKYVAFKLNEMKQNNLPPAEIEKFAKDMKQFSETYKNPFFNALLTYTEILPVGLIISVISGLILKSKKLAL